MSYSLLSQLVRGKWFIESSYASKYGAFVKNVLEGKKIEADPGSRKLHLPRYMDEGGYLNDAPDDQPAEVQDVVMVIPIIGPIVKYDEWCGPVGTQTLLQYLQQAANNPRIAGVVLNIDSPGGMADGTKTLADYVLDFPKPIVAFVNDGLCCSAAYFIAAGADEIIASQKSDIIGSIGVMCVLADMEDYWKQQGIVLHEIYAEQSTEKNKIFREALDGNYKPVQQNILNPAAREFIDFVKAGRGNKLKANEKSVLSGATFTADVCIDNGLIDSIGPFESAVDAVRKMSQKQKQTMSKPTLGQKLAAFFTGKGKEAKETDEINQEHVTEMENVAAENERLTKRVSDLDAALNTATTSLNDAVKKATDLQTSLDAATKERDEWKTKAEEYGSQPGATHTKVKAAGEREPKKEEVLSTVDVEARKLQEEMNQS